MTRFEMLRRTKVLFTYPGKRRSLRIILSLPRSKFEVGEEVAVSIRKVTQK